MFPALPSLVEKTLAARRGTRDHKEKEEREESDEPEDEDEEEYIERDDEERRLRKGLKCMFNQIQIWNPADGKVLSQ